MRPAAPETATRITPRSESSALDRRQRTAEEALVAADRRDRHARRRVQLAGEPLEVLARDRLEALDRLVERQQRSVHQHRAPEPVHARARRLHRQREPALDVLARAAQLVLADPLVAHARQLAADHVERLDDVVLARADVDADLAGVLVLARPRVDRVGEAALLAHLLEQARRRRAAQDRVEDRQGEAAIVVARDALSAEADVVLLGLLRSGRRRAARGAAAHASGACAARRCARRPATARASCSICSCSRLPAAATTIAPGR